MSWTAHATESLALPQLDLKVLADEIVKGTGKVWESGAVADVLKKALEKVTKQMPFTLVDTDGTFLSICPLVYKQSPVLESHSQRTVLTQCVCSSARFCQLQEDPHRQPHHGSLHR